MPFADEDRRTLLPLHGVRILDFTRVLAGPYCTALLADIGADVIKIEPPQGDDYRHIGPFQKDGSSALFECVNRGKRSIVLDLTSARDREVACDLARDADVVVENFRPGVADKLGVGWEALSKVNSRLIYASISGFGQDGPNSRRPAYDLILQAMSGIMSITGASDGPAMPVGESVADVSSGLFASWAILAALVGRSRDGKGKRIDLSMFDSMVALLPTAVARYLATGDVPHRVGNRHALSAPFGSFRARDGELMITVLNEKLFSTLAKCMGRPELAEDPRFASDSLRLQHEKELRREIESWLAGMSVADAVSHLVTHGVPASEIANIEGALSSPQVLARPVLQQAEHPTLGLIRLPEQPARFSQTPRGCTGRAPRLGEHQDAIDALVQERRRGR